MLNRSKQLQCEQSPMRSPLMPLRPVNRDQACLLPPTLDDLLPQDHPARFVAALADGLDRDAWKGMAIDVDGDPPRCSGVPSVGNTSFTSKLPSMPGTHKPRHPWARWGCLGLLYPRAKDYLLPLPWRFPPPLPSRSHRRRFRRKTRGLVKAIRCHARRTAQRRRLRFPSRLPIPSRA